MASLYRKPIVVRDPKTGERIKTQSRKWWGRYRDPHLGVEKRVPLCTDKAAAQTMLANLVKKAERRAVGLTDPFDDSRRKPLTQHLDDFQRFLRGKGNTMKHARQTAKRVRRILDGCRFARLPDISPSAVVNWLKGEREGGRLSIPSSNYYLASIKAFLN